jgi:hypothetical protein
MGLSLTQVIEEHGPAIFADLQTGTLITMSNAGLSWWKPQADGSFVLAATQPARTSLHLVSVADAIDQAEAWFRRDRRRLK